MSILQNCDLITNLLITGICVSTDPANKEIFDVILQMEGASHQDVENDQSHWIMFSQGERFKRAKKGQPAKDMKKTQS